MIVSTHTYRSIQLFHGFQSIFTSFKVYKSIVFNFFHSLDFAIGFKSLAQLIISDIGLQISNVQDLHLRETISSIMTFVLTHRLAW